MANQPLSATLNTHEPRPPGAVVPVRPFSSRLRPLVAPLVTLLVCALLVWGAYLVGGVGNEVLRRFQAYPARNAAMPRAGWSLWPGARPRQQREGVEPADRP